MKKFILLLFLSPLISFGQNTKIKDFKITILSTMFSDTYIGEWGFSAIIEADGQRILFDTGSIGNTVFRNARELNINLDNMFFFVSSFLMCFAPGNITMSWEIEFENNSIPFK